MARIVGLDLGSSAVKAVAVEAGFRTLEVRAARLVPHVVEAPAEVPAPAPESLDVDRAPDDGSNENTAKTAAPSPESWVDRTRRALGTLVADGFLKADSIVTALPAAQVATHLVSLPFGDQKRVEQTLRFEIEGLIPFELDEVAFDWHVVSRTPTRTDLLVIVARREDVAAHLALLADAGVDPRTVTFSATALGALFHGGLLRAPPSKGKKQAPANDEVEGGFELVVDVGEDRTNVLLVENGAPRFARTLSTGGAEVTRAVSKALGVAPALAERAKQSLRLDGDNDPTVQVVLERAAASLARELRATLSGSTARGVVVPEGGLRRLHLTGGGSRLGGLDAFLMDALHVPVRRLELTSVAFPEPEALPEHALALALAATGAAVPEAPRLNFRKGAFASARDTNQLRGRIGALVAMSLVLLVLAGVNAWAKLRVLEERDARHDEVLCETTQKILGKCETDFRVALGRLKGRGSPAASVPGFGGAQVVQAITEVFPGGGEVLLNDLDVVEANIRLKGDAANFDAVDALILALQKNNCLGDVRKGGRLMKNKDGRVEFEVDAAWTCGQSTRPKSGS